MYSPDISQLDFLYFKTDAKQEREILSKLDFIPSAPTNRPPTDSTNNVPAPERRPQGRSYYDAGNNLDNGNPITTQQRQPYVTALNSSGVVLNRLRKVPPTENVSGAFSHLTLFFGISSIAQVSLIFTVFTMHALFKF